MSRSGSRVPLVAMMVLAFGAAPFRSALADPILTPINAGNEVPLAAIVEQIETSDGITLDRVYDDQDAFWSVEGEGTVLVRARFAGYNNTFGVIPGTDGGAFIAVVPSLSGNGIAGAGGFVTPLPTSTREFRLAIETPSGQIWGSLATDNADSMDHMVTWIDAGDPTHYFVAFEDLSLPAGDGDFNDIVLELRHVVDGPLASVPEPTTLGLVGIALAGMVFGRRKKLG